MAYSTNILPKSAAYYSLSNAAIEGSELILNSGGSAEIQISNQMLPKLTEKMLVVVHPSVFSDSYTNDAVQVTLSIITSTGNRIEYLISVPYHKSGVFNTEITLPEEDYVDFTYKISSKVPVSIYNWELCTEEASDVTTIIEGVEQELPKLLYDYNTYSYAVAQKETMVGIISCFLHAETDLQGHFTLSFFATERCNVHVRIKDNGVIELFSPQVYTVERGYASISIPHAYLKKKATDHSFTVSVQCTNGQLSIPVRGLLYTIDGGYLATRLLDAGIDVQDISIRQVTGDSSPSEIWALGFEGDRLILKKRVYSQLQGANWTAVKDFGEAITGAVEFNGIWKNRANADAYTLETQEIPFVFVLSVDNRLLAYHGSDFTTTYVLDTNVTSLSACQGFSNTTENKDQGIVLAYIRNGNAYYRQWLYDEHNDAYIWFAPELLYDGGDASFVSIHRLPDYRLGICVRVTDNTIWYITDRTWVGQAVKPEMVRASAECLTVASVVDTNMAPESSQWVATQNEFSEENTSHNGFVMTFDGTLKFLNNKDATTFKDMLNVYIDNKLLDKTEIRDVLLNDNSIAVYLSSPVIGGKNVKVSFNCPYLVLKIYNGSLAHIKQEYSWSLPLPTYYASKHEDVSASVSSELNLMVREVLEHHSTVQELVIPAIDAELDAVVYEIKESSKDAKEDAQVSVSTEITLTVLQTGVTPV